jgi:hypothetical protein
MGRSARAGSRPWPVFVIVAAQIAGASLVASPGLADGAVALGRPANITKDGVAIGVSYGFPDKEEANKRALEECRTSKSASETTRKLCQTIANYKDQCVAVSIDPKDGTPGFGWAIGIDKTIAQKEALAACVASAGSTRQKFCKNSLLRCDGTANQ